jgi:hypothetical protein
MDMGVEVDMDMEVEVEMDVDVEIDLEMDVDMEMGMDVEMEIMNKIIFNKLKRSFIKKHLKIEIGSEYKNLESYKKYLSKFKNDIDSTSLISAFKKLMNDEK